ncbi:unnamed protein product [Larinioides sclopetarius]|uniref:Uncharacterized protein n=1 Tax=Larinioides sclopetarius TaxID=280406 RepID=A0AAV1ZGQ4_9ARAC
MSSDEFVLLPVGGLNSPLIRLDPYHFGFYSVLKWTVCCTRPSPALSCLLNRLVEHSIFKV